jgi:uncharacterized caspase-like protein
VTKRAVIVGVNDYSVQGYNDLRFCVPDAASMYHLLRDAFLFEEPNMFYLANADATSSRIRQTIRYVLTQSQPGDTVCFYYSGHGGSVANPAVPTQMFETIIPYSGQHISDHELFTLADTLEPSHVNFTIILDSCFSGGMHEEAERSRRARSPAFSPELQESLAQCRTLIPCGICLPPPARQALDNNITRVQPRGEGVVVEEDAARRLVQQAKSTLISASTAAQVSWEHETLGHGLLTHALINLPTASNFSITYNDLIQELSQRVDQMTRRHFPGETQTPQLRGQANRMTEEFLVGFSDSR